MTRASRPASPGATTAVETWHPLWIFQTPPQCSHPVDPSGVWSWSVSVPWSPEQRISMRGDCVTPSGLPRDDKGPAGTRTAHRDPVTAGQDAADSGAEDVRLAVTAPRGGAGAQAEEPGRPVHLLLRLRQHAVLGVAPPTVRKGVPCAVEHPLPAEVAQHHGPGCAPAPRPACRPPRPPQGSGPAGPARSSSPTDQPWRLRTSPTARSDSRWSCRSRSV